MAPIILSAVPKLDTTRRVAGAKRTKAGEMKRVNNGELLSMVSACLLVVCTFLHWFEIEAINTSNLLFEVQSTEPAKNAWQALEYIPIMLVATSVVTLVVVGLRFVGGLGRRFMAMNVVIVVLALACMLSIALRIIDPPVFYVDATVTYKGTSQLPMFIALLGAAGIAVGSGLAIRECDAVSRSS